MRTDASSTAAHLMLLATLCACPSDPAVPADAGSGTEGEASTSGSVEPDGAATTSSSDAGTISPDGTSTLATGPDDATSTGPSLETTGTSESATDDSGTDTGTSGPVATCGDGMMEGDEACDDAGESVQCNADCTLAECGDGTLNVTAGEACDDEGESVQCNADCTVAGCGDGVLNVTAGEACDDGGETPLCNVGCTLAECGDGIFNASAGELCDGGGRSATCNADCTPASCGDGVLNVTAGEACDDAGESPACNLDCSLSLCGDGITNLTAGEVCDDAGASLGCDVDCTIPQCGDSVVNPATGEQCDGSALASGTCQAAGFYGGTLACDAGCLYDTSGCNFELEPPVLELDLSQVKHFDFTWAPVTGADWYELLESPGPGELLVPIAGGIVGQSYSLTVPLHFRYQASYVLRACNIDGCSESLPLAVMGSLAEAVGFFKASNPYLDDQFGNAVAISADGDTLAVGAWLEDSDATGIDGDQTNNFAPTSGAVYVFVRDASGQWSQQAYVKASFNNGGDEWFGHSLSLSADGDTLAVGAPFEDSNATGVGGNEVNDLAPQSGAVYVFTRDAMEQWSQQAYVKASNTGADDWFGWSVALSGDGDTLAVGGRFEDSSATGIDGQQANELAVSAGAVYVYGRDDLGAWSQQAYLKASNTGAGDQLGYSVALSLDGDTLVAGAWQEDGGATGIGGNGADDSASGAGAVYVYGRDDLGAWSQQAYVKASNTDSGDNFGNAVALSDDGHTLAVAAYYENGGATGIDGDQADDNAANAGAVYVLVRDGAGTWSQQVYIKASNPDAQDWFGYDVALSGDGSVLAVGSWGEDSSASGLDGDQADDAMEQAGAAYVFVRDAGAWSQRGYVKNPVPYFFDNFGTSVALASGGATLVVGAPGESSNAIGIGGEQEGIEFASASGAVYLY